MNVSKFKQSVRFQVHYTRSSSSQFSFRLYVRRVKIKMFFIVLHLRSVISSLNSSILSLSAFVLVKFSIHILHNLSFKILLFQTYFSIHSFLIESNSLACLSILSFTPLTILLKPVMLFSIYFVWVSLSDFSNGLRRRSL